MIEVTQLIGFESGWKATMQWPDDVINGGPARMVIEPVDQIPVGGLSSTVLREINFREANATFLTQQSTEPTPVDGTILRNQLANGITPEYLATLAWFYTTAVTRGQPKINDHLAALLGKSVGTVRGHVWQARKRGYLTGAPGRLGGELTDKSLQVLKGVNLGN